MFNKDSVALRNSLNKWFYKHILKPIFFKFDPEMVHDHMTAIGQFLSKNSVTRKIANNFWGYAHPSLEQNILGIHFKNPIGLSAGFDYKANLIQILPAVGFGFGTIGTITNLPCPGNLKPRLGRLPKSKSLLVNKGFRNLGIEKTLEKLVNNKFENPVGISIGQTNIAEISSLEIAISDVVSAFKKVEASKIPFSYYELNISCPNLTAGFSFYSPENLNKLLMSVTKLSLSLPLFIKMPIDKSNEESLAMLTTISKFKVEGVIFGNLQKNRQDPAIVPAEVAKLGKGNFSGMPTQKRSDELIRLSYKNFGDKLIIIGSGGVFSAEDAYRKIKAGASLIQLITGMIFEGPQLISDINLGLVKLLQKDGYKNISEAIGKE